MLVLLSVLFDLCIQGAVMLLREHAEHGVFFFEMVIFISITSSEINGRFEKLPGRPLVQRDLLGRFGKMVQELKNQLVFSSQYFNCLHGNPPSGLALRKL